MTVSCLHYVCGRNTLELYLSKLFDDKAIQKQLITTIARFISDKECRYLVLSGNHGTGKSFLKELIAPLMGLKRYNVENIEYIPKHILSSMYVLCAMEVPMIDLDYLSNTIKTPGKHKYIIETNMTTNNLNRPNIAHITLTKSQLNRPGWDNQMIIMNELF